MYAYDAPSLAPFIPSSWKQLLRQIEHLAQFGGAVQVISGAEGSGKTTFLGELVRQSPPAQDLVCWPVIEEAWTGQALQSLLAALGIETQSGQSMGQSIVSLRHYAQNLQRQKKRVVVAVDDSDLLTDASLAGVASVLQGGAEEGVGLHVIFFTQRSLAARLDRLQLIDVTVYDFELPSFTVQEIGELLAVHYEDIVQREAIRPLTRDDMQDIWQASHGMPGIAVTIAKEKWALGLLGKSRFSLGGFPFMHLLTLLLALAALYWVMWGRNTPPAEGQAPSGIVTNLTPQVTPASSTAATINSTPPPIEMKKIETPATPAEGAAAAPETAAPETARPDSPAAALAAQVAETQALKQQQAAAKAEAATKPEAVKAEAIKPESPKPETPKPAPKTAPKVPAAEDPPMMPSPAKAPPAKSAAVSVDDNASWVVGSKKLAKLPENQYVIQLQFSTSAKKIDDAIAAAPNKKDLTAYHTVRNGKDVYILVEGNYADSKAASAAIKNLPADQKAGQPWPKKIGAIHAELRAGGDKN